MKTVDIIVTGKVQGVFYRQSTRKKARSLGIKGTVRNLPDGSVQILAIGDDDRIEFLIQWCKQGPPKAMVVDVTVVAVNREMNFDDFLIIR